MRERFRPSLRPYRLLILWSFAPLAAFFTVTGIWKQWGDWTAVLDELRLTAVIFVSIPTALYAFFALLAVVYAVSIDQHGIRAYTAFGWFKTVSWASITDVSLVTLSGLPYLVLRSSESRFALYVPGDLADAERFDALVLQYVDERNPLWEWFAPAAQEPA